MFTGLVEAIGTISSIKPSPEGGTITLTITNCASILTDVALGDSISINGTCLTVTSFTPQSSPTSFSVDAVPETLRRTNLGRLQESSRANLERAVSASTRMGGHFVQGHVDTVATISKRTPDQEAVVLRLVPRDQRILRYVVEKGYVTLDGASLTVTRVFDPAVTGTGSASATAGGAAADTRGNEKENEGWWEIMLIPYTQEKIVTASKQVGDEVNVEIDVVGKYVERAVEGYFAGAVGSIDADGAGAATAGTNVPTILEKMVGRIVDARLQAADIGAGRQ